LKGSAKRGKKRNKRRYKVGRGKTGCQLTFVTVKKKK